MSVAITATPTVVSRTGHGVQRGLFRARELGSTTVLVAAVGEIDASNSGELLGFIESRLSGYRQLVLDLSRLAFFGTDGFSALHTMNVRLSRRGVEWVLVPGPEVARVLRVCDPENLVTTATNIVSAVAALARGPHTHLQLTPQPK
ncbi:STAS domain-containing protein [Mycolicibacterium sp. CBM1]